MNAKAMMSIVHSVKRSVLVGMMCQRVDKNTRGLVIYKGRKYVNK